MGFHIPSIAGQRHRPLAAHSLDVGLLGFSGLAFYALGQSTIMPTLLAIHLGAVLSFFLLTSSTKMAHGSYRLTALIAEASRQK